MRGVGTVKLYGRMFLGICASARSVVAHEVFLVSASHLRREGQGWAFSDEASSRTVRRAALVLAEALTTFQAGLLQRHLPSSMAVDRARPDQAQLRESTP
jgi:hypothetical protein